MSDNKIFNVLAFILYAIGGFGSGFAMLLAFALTVNYGEFSQSEVNASLIFIIAGVASCVFSIFLYKRLEKFMH